MTEKPDLYLRRDQVEKLDELVFAYNRQTTRRINRNDVVGQLLDQRRSSRSSWDEGERP